MAGYRQFVSLDAVVETVLSALVTPWALREWWTEDCVTEGKMFTVRFGQTQKTMLILKESAEQVRWRCVAAHLASPDVLNPTEWVGTEVVFTLRRNPEGGTQLEFVHEGLTSELECFELCVEGWGHYLGSLKRYAETGHGTPYTRSAA